MDDEQSKLTIETRQLNDEQKVIDNTIQIIIIEPIDKLN